MVADWATVYLWMKKFLSMSSDNMISMFLSIFATFGRPLEIRLDSGPSFRHTYEAAMTELGINVQFSSAYHPKGNMMAEQAVSKLKMAISKNMVAVGNQHLQDLSSSLNNISSSVPGAGTASERLLGYSPRFDLPILLWYFPPAKREEMLEALRVRRDESSRKIKNQTYKDF